MTARPETDVDEPDRPYDPFDGQTPPGDCAACGLHHTEIAAMRLGGNRCDNEGCPMFAAQQISLDIACERCLGTGWMRIHHSIRDEHGIYQDRSNYPDCKRCAGTGIEPKDAPEIDRG